MSVKTARRPKSCKELVRLELPEHVTLSDGELAVFTRLIRVMRQKDERGPYWLGPFIEWLLYLDATDPDLNYVNVHIQFWQLSIPSRLTAATC